MIQSDEERGRRDDAGFSNRMVGEILEERGDEFGGSEVELGAEEECGVRVSNKIRNDRFP